MYIICPTFPKVIPQSDLIYNWIPIFHVLLPL